MGHVHRAFSCLILSLFLLLPASCSQEQQTDFLKEPDKLLVWPPEPFKPRIQWIRQITSDDLIELKPGFWNRIGRFLFGTEKSAIIRSHGIYVNGDGILFIADPGARAIHVLDPVHRRYSMINSCGQTSFKSPIDFAMDEVNHLYVTDSAAGFVCRYKIDNGELKIGKIIARMERPTGISYNPRNGLIYVAKTTAHQIIAIDKDGKSHITIGSSGAGPGKFNFPIALTVNHQGEVLVVDSLNARIQIFTPDGQFIRTFGQPGDLSGFFAKPKGIAVDSEDHIYVVDTLFDAVQLFDTNGQLLMNFGSSGRNPGQFWLPSGIFIDRNDFIYVSDTYNQRIQVFKYLKHSVPDAEDRLEKEQTFRSRRREGR